MKNLLLTKEDTDNIDYSTLLLLKKKYWRFLEEFPFPTPINNASVSEMLSYFKRKETETIQIGCYKNITVFEAANRIATDLVIINGVIQLAIENQEIKKQRFILRLGTRHEKGKGDFSIGEKEGEAFNVAPSFLKVKLRNTLNKWKKDNGQLSYILINAEVAEAIPAKNYGPEIIKVVNWDRPYNQD